MMTLERAAYILMGLSGLVMVALAAVAVQDAEASFPETVAAGAFLLGLALLFVKALRDRVTSAEDDHYDKTVEL